jgi:prenyltransferase beta subunit
MMIKINRRDFIQRSAATAAGIAAGFFSCGYSFPGIKPRDILRGAKNFLYKTANPDGSFQPGIDPNYLGRSDTGLSGIAAPAYAVIICKTFGWELPYPDETKNFFLKCQNSDGSFYAPSGTMDQNSPLAKLYNTVQSTVALRLLDTDPVYNPIPVIEHFFKEGGFTELPLYTTSFFALFYSAWHSTMPLQADRKMKNYIQSKQGEEGYISSLIPSTYHAAHYFRLTGRSTPKADKMVSRVLREQKADGSWLLNKPDWDVHACFDALFILRQLGNNRDASIEKAYEKATGWILNCRNLDEGFSHFPGNDPSDVDALYFHLGGLVQSVFLPTNISV